MGFFSWRTSDTDEIIWNSFTGKCKPVYLYCPDGKVICEPEYEGYGVFGEEDAFELLAEWNKGVRDRKVGIYLEPEEIKYPLKFSFSPNQKYEDMPGAKNAENQGYFEFR